MTIAIPCFESAVTDALLDEMLSTGLWVSHGGEIRNQWDGGCFEWWARETHPHLVDRPYDEASALPEFRGLLRSVVLASAREQRARLVDGFAFDDLPPLTADTLLHRGISADAPTDPIGVHWSQNRLQSLHRFIDRERGGLLLVVRAGDVGIDWDATIRSRLDLENGQDEAEIALIAGSPIVGLAHPVTCVGDVPTTGTGVRFAGRA